MKLNWRDASKELPSYNDDCIVIDSYGIKGIGFYENLYSGWTVYETDTSAFTRVNDREIKYWLPLNELPIPIPEE